MMTRLLTRFTVTVCVLLGFVAVSQAQTLSIGPGNGFAAITYPASWEVSRIARGVQGATKDEEVYIWAEAYTLETIDTILKEHEAYFSKQGVATSGKSTSQDGALNGVTAKFLTIDATWNGKPTLLQYVLLDPGPATKWKLILCEWASPEGEKLYGSDTNGILQSVTFKAQ